VATFAELLARSTKDMRVTVSFSPVGTEDETAVGTNLFATSTLWTVGLAATDVTLNTAAFVSGASSLSFGKTTASTGAQLDATIGTGDNDWSGYDWARIRFYSPSDACTAADVDLFTGTASDAYRLRFSFADIVAGWNLLHCTFDSATSTGTSYASTDVDFLRVTAHGGTAAIAGMLLSSLTVGSYGVDADMPTFCNGSISTATSTDLHYDLAHVGAVSAQVDPFEVRASARSMSLAITDRDGYCTNLLAQNEIRNRVVDVNVGFASLPESDYEGLFKGMITGYRYDAKKIGWQFTVADLRRELRKTIFTGAASTAVTATGVNPINYMYQIMVGPAPNGMAISPDFIDGESLLTMRDDYYSALTMDFDIREPWDGWAFVEEQIAKPLGFYITTDGEGRISVKRVRAPLWNERLTNLELDDSNIIGVPTVEESLSDLLNEIYWQVDYDADADEYDTKTLYVDSDSLTLYRQSKRVEVESQGLDSSDTTFIETRNAILFSRFSEPYPRYKLKAKLETMQIREGDIVKFKHSALPDLAIGDRAMADWHLCEVMKVSTQIGMGSGAAMVDIELLDTPWSFTKTIVISPSTMTTDYDASSGDDHLVYGWIADTSDQLGAANDPAYTILEG